MKKLLWLILLISQFAIGQQFQQIRTSKSASREDTITGIGADTNFVLTFRGFGVKPKWKSHSILLDSSSKFGTVSNIVARDKNGNTHANNFESAILTQAGTGTITLTGASQYYNQLTGSVGCNIILPNATTLLVGHTFQIDNNSIGTDTIRTNGGSILALMVPGSNAFFKLYNNSSAPGSWDYHWLMPESAIFGTSGLTVSGSISATSIIGTTTWTAAVIQRQYLADSTLLNGTNISYTRSPSGITGNLTGIVSGTLGGTGVNNGSSTFTYASNLNFNTSAKGYAYNHGGGLFTYDTTRNNISGSSGTHQGTVSVSAGAISINTLVNDSSLWEQYGNVRIFNLYAYILRYGGDSSDITDCSTALNNAFLAANNYKGSSTIWVPKGRYAFLDSATAVLGGYIKSQILITTDTSIFNAYNQKTITLEGSQPGAVLFDDKIYTSKNGIAFMGSGAPTGLFNHVYFDFLNINVKIKYNTSLQVLNLEQEGNTPIIRNFMFLTDSSFYIGVNNLGGKLMIPRCVGNVGIVMPQNNNDWDKNTVSNGIISGFYAGILAGESTVISPDVTIYYCYYDMLAPNSNNVITSSFIAAGQYQIVKAIGTVGYTPTGGFAIGNPTSCPLNIITMSGQNGEVGAKFPTWAITAATLDDSLQKVKGYISYYNLNQGDAPLLTLNNTACFVSVPSTTKLTTYSKMPSSGSGMQIDYFNQGTGATRIILNSDNNTYSSQWISGATGQGEFTWTTGGAASTPVLNLILDNDNFEWCANNSTTNNINMEFNASQLRLVSNGQLFSVGTLDANNFRIESNNATAAYISTSQQWAMGNGVNPPSRGAAVQGKPGNQVVDLYQAGGAIFDLVSTQSSPANTSENVLHKDTIVANELANNGDGIHEIISGTILSTGGTTKTIKVYFGTAGTTADTLFLSTGALTISTGSAYEIDLWLTRLSSTSVGITYTLVVSANTLGVIGNLQGDNDYFTTTKTNVGTTISWATIKYITLTATSTVSPGAGDVTENVVKGFWYSAR